MMHWSDALRDFVIGQMATVKVTGTVAGGTVGIGAAGALGLIHGTLSICAMAAGVAVTVLLARYHVANERTSRLKNKLLEKQCRDAGIDPDIE